MALRNLTPDELLHEWCEGRVTKQPIEDELDWRDNQARRRLARLNYRPERDTRGWLVLLVYAAAIGVVCWWTKGS